MSSDSHARFIAVSRQAIKVVVLLVENIAVSGLVSGVILIEAEL